MRVRRGFKRRAHFAHINKDFDSICNPETVLHKAFKIALHERFQEHIVKPLPLPINWHCLKCGQRHEGNILRKARASRLEYDVGDFTADVALLDECQKTICAIEVAVTNPPNEEKVAYYKRNGIWLVIFRLESDEDIVKAKETPLLPTSFDFCPDAFRNKNDGPALNSDFGMTLPAQAIPTAPDKLKPSGTPDGFTPASAIRPFKSPVIKTVAILLLLAITAIAILFIWMKFIR